MRRMASRSALPAGLLSVVLLAGCTGASSSVPPSTTGGVAAPTSSPSLPAASLAPAPSLESAPASPSSTPAASAGQPSPTPVPIPALTQTFRSPTMGFTVRYPAGWIVHKASEPWRPGWGDLWDDPNGDRIESETAGFRGGSQRLLPGQTAAEWISAYLSGADPNCGVREQIRVGGTTATINLNGCDGEGRLGGRVYDLVVGVGDRVYNFTMEGEVDRGFLDAMLATVGFDPASAVDRP